MDKIANKLLETVKPMLDKMVDDTDDRIPENQLDATIKIVKLAEKLYSIDVLKHRLMHMDKDMDEAMEYDEMADNPKKKEMKSY